MKNRKLLRLFLCGFAATWGSATAAQAESFKDYLQSQNSEFNTWKSEQDKAFYQFLKKGWKDYKLAPPIEVKRPKPETFPEAKPHTPVKQTPIVIGPDQVEPIIAPPEIKTKKSPVYKPVEQPKTGFSMNFYGRKLYWTIDSSWRTVRAFQVIQINKDKVAAFWKAFVQADTAIVIQEFNAYSQQLNLNGWGRLQLAYQLSRKLTTSLTEQKLMTWALMVKMNEAVRLGYNTTGVYLLYHSRQKLFNVNYWTYESKKYYVFEPDGAANKVSNLFTYKGDFSDSVQTFDLDYRQNPYLYLGDVERTIRFNFKGKSYAFDMPVSKDYVDYLYSLPLQAPGVYFSREPAKILQEKLIPEVKSVVSKMSEEDAINFLLAFVQKGLKYKLDKDQFNRSEKYLMPEETLYYVYSDCEDHSFLFAWLVKQTLGLPIVGIEYPGHIATAIASRHEVGKIYIYNGQRYAVSDPTYINATYGTEMPQFKNAKVKIIPIH